MTFEATFETDDNFNAEFSEGGGGGSGSDVKIKPVLTEGIKIADFSIDGKTGELYALDDSGAIASINSTLEQIINKIGGLETGYRYYRFYIMVSARNGKQQDFANVAGLRILNEEGVDVSRLPGTLYFASSNYSGNPPDNAFDDDPLTIWETDYKSAKSYINWIGVVLPEKQTVTGFSIMPRAVDGTNKDTWTAFQFQCSPDGEFWLPMYAGYDITDWTQGEYKDFTI